MAAPLLAFIGQCVVFHRRSSRTRDHKCLTIAEYNDASMPAPAPVPAPAATHMPAPAAALMQAPAPAPMPVPAAARRGRTLRDMVAAPPPPPLATHGAITGIYHPPRVLFVLAFAARVRPIATGSCACLCSRHSVTRAAWQVAKKVIPFMAFNLKVESKVPLIPNPDLQTLNSKPETLLENSAI